MRQTFQSYLESENLSGHTIEAYVWTADYFKAHYGEATKENLLAYKKYLMDVFRPKTVNLRIQAMNKYLAFLGKGELRLSSVKIQQKSHLENVISNADYEYLKNQLKKDGNLSWYFVVWYLGATGARVSELISFKVEHVLQGCLDLYGKGGKTRRLYIPKALREETMEWLEKEGRGSGFLFLNRQGAQISTRGVGQQLKRIAERYHVNRDVVYPHSFRHLYAKNFLERCGDIALLSDLLGHENIETTRIYLRRTSLEQREMIDDIVVW